MSMTVGEAYSLLTDKGRPGEADEAHGLLDTAAIPPGHLPRRIARLAEMALATHAHPDGCQCRLTVGLGAASRYSGAG